jgi:hypothetical protein
VAVAQEPLHEQPADETGAADHQDVLGHGFPYAECTECVAGSRRIRYILYAVQQLFKQEKDGAMNKKNLCMVGQ